MYAKRIKILIALICVAFAGVAWRLWYVQILSGGQYRRAAAKLLEGTERLHTARGRILDRNGKILAYDQPCFDLCLDYRFMADDERWIRYRKRDIRRQENVTAEQAEEIYRRRADNTWRLAAKHSGRTPEEFRRDIVTPILQRYETLRRRTGVEKLREQVISHPVVAGMPAQIELVDTVGATVRPSSRRWYPRGQAACHVVGLTGQVNAAEQERENVFDDGGDWRRRIATEYRDGDRIGKSGVERLGETALRGRRGFRRFHRKTKHELGHEPAAPGRDMHLTIDIELQRHLADLMGAMHPGWAGCTVILSMPDGEILALVSLPTYDLNRYGQRKYFRQLQADARRPIVHRAVAGLYAPGSTMKPLTAVAALSQGLIDAHTTYTCHGALFPDKPGFSCWIRGQGQHGPVSVVRALRDSCNVFFYRVGERMGIGRQVEWHKQFGYGDRAGSRLSQELAGLLPQRGTVGESRMLAIGQGPVAVTPLHVANAMATIARDGESRPPTILRGGAAAGGVRRLPATAEAFRLVRQGMHEVVNHPQSQTAYKVFHGADGRPIEPLGVEVCGKSGTAEGSGDNTVWFVGFAPARQPRIAFAVLFEHVPPGHGGSATAGPVAREALRWCEKLGYFRHGSR